MTTPDEPLNDDEMDTTAGGTDAAPAGDADGTDGAAGDADGTDGDSTDSTDGDSTDADGTDGGAPATARRHRRRLHRQHRRWQQRLSERA